MDNYVFPLFGLSESERKKRKIADFNNFSLSSHATTRLKQII